MASPGRSPPISSTPTPARSWPWAHAGKRRPIVSPTGSGSSHRHDSYEELVNDPAVDVVYVATPHPMHHADTMLALEAGKPALVEKAFTINGAQARDLVAAARSRGLFLMEAMWTRFLPHMVEVRRLVAGGELGDIVTVTADHGQWFAKDPSSRLFDAELGGGALLDLGVYPVSFASMILGPPERIVAMIDPAFTGVDGQTSMVFGYAGGAQAVLTCTSAAKSPTARRGCRNRRRVSRSTATSTRLPPCRSSPVKANRHGSANRIPDGVCGTKPTRSPAASAPG